MKKALVFLMLIGCGKAAETSGTAPTIAGSATCETKDAPGTIVSSGTVGPQGPKGDPGETGARGEQGPAGAVGPAGAKGDKGDTGDRGPAGATGATGMMGLTGAQGPAGPAGPAGAAGTDVSRAMVYTVIAPTGSLSGAGIYSQPATCLDKTDVLLSGSCITGDAVNMPLLGGNFFNDANLNVSAYYQCSARHNGTGSHVLTAIARCLALP